MKIPRMTSRAENPPEQNTVLIRQGNGKIGEDQQEDKDVVHAERFFDQITGEKFQGQLRPAGIINPRVKGQSQADPDHAPYTGLFARHLARFTMEDPQVQEQQDENNQGETDPEADAGCHAYARESGCYTAGDTPGPPGDG